jgi:hypothetical protein
MTPREDEKRQWLSLAEAWLRAASDYEAEAAREMEGETSYFPAQNYETFSLGQNRLAARKLQGRADLN